MKKRRRLNSKQMVKKSLLLFTMAIAFLATLVLSLTGTENLFSGRTDKNAAGTVPAHRKDRNPNNDGTYKLSLDVVGEVESKPSKANIIVVFDVSGSMSNNTGKSGYAPTTSTSSNNTYYGVVNGEFVRVYRRGSGSNVYFTLTNSNDGERYTGTRYTYVNNMNRLQAAKSAITKLSDSLFANNNLTNDTTADDDIIEMALVTFAFNSSVAQSPTDDATTFNNAVIGLTANGGTNWEAALSTANKISFEDDDPTYVIFVSDGNPTVRDTRGNYNPFTLSDNWNYRNDNAFYNSYGVYGTGTDSPYDENYSAESMGRCYTHAVDDATTIVSGGKTLYTIGIYGNVNRMKDLTKASGADEANYFDAKDTAELNSAFDAILDEINKAGIGSVKIEDGTTNKVVQTSGRIANLLTVDKSSFKYYIDGEEVTTLPEADLNSDGEVVWDLSSVGLLENGKKYTVTFDVWPSQETYDLIADLKNGKITYDSLDSEVRKYLHKDGDNYTLDTNTSAKLYYDDTRTEDEEIPVDYNTLDAVNTTADKIRVSKDWENSVDLTNHPIPDEIDIGVNRGNERYTTTTLEKDKNFVSDEIFISTGLMRVHYTDNTKTTISGIEVLEDGHDYYFSELGEESYNWELVSEVVHPMLLNGELKKLILVNEDSDKLYSIKQNPEVQYSIPEGMEDTDEFYQDETGTYFRINGNVYILTDDDPNISAYNYRRSNLNIQKFVDGDSAPEDALFTFNIKVTDSGIGENDELWFSVYNNGFVDLGNNLLTTDWIKRENSDGIYYHAKNGTTLRVRLKKGENLRFVNLTTKAHYEITEENLPEGFSFKESSYTGWYGDNNGRDLTASELDYNNSEAAKITGNISMTNSAFYAYFTNKYELVNVDVTKVWDDNNDEYKVRPDKVTVQLFADGVAMKDKIVDLIPNNDGTWPTFTYRDLIRYNGNKEIEYTVQEVEPDANYVATISGSQENGKASYTITNTLKMKVSVEKKWEDDGDRDRIRPTSITVNLLANGKATGQSKTLNAGNNWKDTFTGLNKKEAGQDIEYTIEEVEVEQYESVITGSQKDGYVITNTHTPEKIKELIGQKVWLDSNDKDGLRAKSITVELYADGDPTGITYTTDADKDWKYTFTNLDVYKGGNKIKYTVREHAFENQDLYDTDYDDDKLTVINSHEVKSKEISVKKVWKDDDNKYGRPGSVKVTLYGKVAGENVIEPQEETLSNDNNWTYTFKDLPTYKDGKLITYSVDEANVLDYSKAITGNETEGFVITNTYAPATIDIKGKKTWEDVDDQDGIRPKSITVHVLDHLGKEVASQEVHGPDWTFEFKGLVKFANGEKIDYTVEEVSVPDDYNADVKPVVDEETTEESNLLKYEVINTHTPETVSYTITKKWEDLENNDGKRPDSITVQLKVDGNVNKEITIGEEDGWTYTFDNLPKYDHGREIKYEIVESAVDGYEAEYSMVVDENDENSFSVQITNTHEIEKTEVPVVKTWNDNDNKDNTRPSEITVNLYADGELIDTVKITDEMNWTYTFKDLLKFKDGKEIVYTIEEEAVEGYETVIEGFNITNTYIPKPAEKKILPPQTGFENNMNLHYILFAFISAILLLRKRIA